MVDLTITSDPDKDGKHRLQCPQCLVSFFAPITEDDKTDKLQDIICENYHHTAEPLMFILVPVNSTASWWLSSTSASVMMTILW